MRELSGGRHDMNQSEPGPSSNATSNGAVAAGLLRRNRRVFRAVAQTVVPEAAHLDDDAWTEVESIVANALASRPLGLLKQLGLFLRVIDLMAVLRRGRRFDRLSANGRASLLASLERSPVLLLRRGFWGLRTLALMGYYARPDGKREIGYRADPRGWEARTA
jgi:hypothetical protein